MRTIESLAVTGEQADDWCERTEFKSELWPSEPQPRPRLDVVVSLAPPADELAAEFEQLAQTWEDETWIYSVLDRKAMHPAYQAIIGMGRDALPFIFRRLAEGPDHWFWALEAITRENPATGAETMVEATDAWLAWARERGYG